MIKILILVALSFTIRETMGQDSLILKFTEPDEVLPLGVSDTAELYNNFKADSLFATGFRLFSAKKITSIFTKSRLYNCDSIALIDILGRPSFVVEDNDNVLFCYYILPLNFDTNKYDFRMFIRFYYDKKYNLKI